MKVNVYTVIGIVLILMFVACYIMGQQDSERRYKELFLIQEEELDSYRESVADYDRLIREDQSYIHQLRENNKNLSIRVSSLCYLLEHTWDYRLMCQLVEAEASGLSIDEKQKVASVIFNRVKSDKFPDTIMDVITATGQFTPIGNGVAYETEATDGTKIAVYKATLCDNSEGALFFNDYYSLAFTDYYDNDLELVSRNKDISFYKFKEEKK